MLQRDIPFCEKSELLDSGRPIVYLDETWVNAHHTVTSKWYNCSANPGRDAVQAEAPTRKGKSLVILHACYEGGFSMTVLSFLLVKPIPSTIMMK